MADMDDDDLLEALGVEAAPTKASTHTAQQERLIAGFEDILRFVETHGRVPQHGEGRDIFERIYAVRLDRLRSMPEAHDLLIPMDKAGLLDAQAVMTVNPEELDDEALLAELGAGTPGDESDITQLRHVSSYADRRAAEEIANRTRCQDFEAFRPLFEKVRRELDQGVRRTTILETRSLDEIQQGTFFIISGQIAYVAEEYEEFTTDYERRDGRLRVIYDNGTEGELLQRSLQRALHRDKVARLISEPIAGPLFGDALEPDDVVSGTIYVLRSLSSMPYVVEHRELIHKIGVTGGKVEARIANAARDATYLLADVEVVATYTLSNVNRTKLENLFHRIFGSVQLDLTIDDRFGNPVKPREWFLVPLHVIDEAVSRIRDGSITDMKYDPKTASLVPR
ncbi:GIY-YIG nuclease family protein [Stenotrophomonas sp. Y-13]|uniref:GIY-YIG nuclease family protein n=1 Tax=Stenotrophomonas sp. Y-13 TaxID=3384161 RepID=UPI003917432E